MEKIAASIAQIAAEALAEATAESRTVTLALPAEVMASLSAWIADRPEPRPLRGAGGRRGARGMAARPGIPSATSESPPDA